MDTEPVGYDITFPAPGTLTPAHEEEVAAFTCREAVHCLIRDAQTAGRWIDWSTLRIEVVTTVSGLRLLRASASGVGRREPVNEDAAMEALGLSNLCPYEWGIHACDLVDGHDGDHECRGEDADHECNVVVAGRDPVQGEVAHG